MTGSRAGGLAALAFAALLAASAAVAHAPRPDAPAAEVARAFARHADAQRTAAYLVALAGACALGFAVALRGRLGGRAGDLALAAAAVSVALVVSGQAAHAALALQSVAGAAQAGALFALGNALFALAWPALALLVGACVPRLPRVPAAASAALAVWLALLPVAGTGSHGPLALAGAAPVVSLLALLVWTVAAGVVLLLR